MISFSFIKAQLPASVRWLGLEVSLLKPQGSSIFGLSYGRVSCWPRFACRFYGDVFYFLFTGGLLL